MGNCRGRKVNSAKLQSFLPLALNFTKMEVHELEAFILLLVVLVVVVVSTMCTSTWHRKPIQYRVRNIRKSFAKSCESRERRKSCKDLKYLTSFTEYKFDEISSKTRQMSSKIRTCASAMMRSS